MGTVRFGRPGLILFALIALAACTSAKEGAATVVTGPPQATTTTPATTTTTPVVFALEPRSRSSFNDDYQATPYIEAPWPFEPPAFGCFSLQGPEAHDFVELLPSGDENVLWILDEDLAFLTWSERWLLPYETPCEPDVPPLSARFDQ